MAQQAEQNNSSNNTPPAAPAPAAPIPSPRQLKPYSVDAARTLNLSGVTFSEPSTNMPAKFNFSLTLKHDDHDLRLLPPSAFSSPPPTNLLHPSYTTDVPFIGQTKFNFNLTNPKKAVGFSFHF